MSLTIQPVTAVPGVNCVVLFDPATNIAEQHAAIPYEEVVLRDLLTRVGSVQDNCTSVSIDGNPKMFQIFEQGFVAVRTTNGHTLVAIATKETNTAMLGIAMNMVAKKLSTLKVKAVTPPPPPIPVPDTKNSEDTEQVDSSSSSGANTSNRISSRSINMSMSWTDQTERQSQRYLTEDAIGIKVMQHLLVRLARLVGKHDATLFLEDELHSIGETPGTIKHEQFGDLIKRVAQRITDPAKRNNFIIQALGDTPTS